jgi:hypothetical protein
MVRVRVLIFVVGMAVLSQPASAGCDAALTASLDQAQRLADSLRVDKPSLARVFAADGSEFTAGQALWLKGQLREVRRACALSQQPSATARLGPVQELIKARAPRAIRG